jgi:Ni/Fe-hydrogenase subunit HybB-like protein
MTLALTVFGVILSTLHQSSLGGLYLIAPSKMHPLWYSSYLPLAFFVSSIVAGLSMVIFEGALSYRYLRHKMDAEHIKNKDDLAIGFAKAASFILAGYFFIQVVGLTVDNDWVYLNSGYGAWYLLEMGGFVALPCFLFAMGAREKNVRLIRWTALLGVLGIVLNRFNVSLVAFNWHLPLSERYFPSWMEFVISIFLVTLGILAYTFVVTRMPVLYEHPEYSEE